MTARSSALLPDWVVPVVPEGAVLTATAVVVEGERIRALIPQSELSEKFPDCEPVALPGRALIPGLINMHTHSAMALFRGLADDLPLMRWLDEHIWPAERQWVGPKFVRDGSELAVAEMLKGGTTCFNDNYFFPDVTAEVALRAGMRAVVGIPLIRFPTAWAGSEDEYFRRGLEVHQRFVGEALVATSFAPHAPYTVTDQSFRRLAVLAEELDIPVHLHLLEAAGEIEASREEFGLHPLDRLEQLGLLGPRLLAVHMTQVAAADIERLARNGVHVLHCPNSNLKLASGICPVAALDTAGVNVCIGTDSAASNNQVDLFGEMRTAALLAKGYSGDPEAVPAARALSMVTLHGARALGQEDTIGSIEVGKQADLVAVSLDGIETRPVHNVVSQLVYAVSRSQVTDVWIAGRPVVCNRELKTLDEAEICDRARRWQQKLALTA